MNASLHAFPYAAALLKNVMGQPAATSQRYGSWIDFPINPFNVLVLNSFMCGIISFMLKMMVDFALQRDLKNYSYRFSLTEWSPLLIQYIFFLIFLLQKIYHLTYGNLVED